MKKIMIPVIIIAVALFSILLFNSDPIYRKTSPAASKGQIDLSRWNFMKNGPAYLNGEWECYDGQLLTPSDFQGTGRQTPRLTGYADLTAGRVGNPSLHLTAPKGVRTFRLLIKTTPLSQTFGLTVDNINMCSCLYVNGTLQGEKGTPALKGDGYEQRPQAYNAYFQLQGEQTAILLQVANFDYPFAGMQYTLRFGLQNDISASMEMAYAIELCGAVIAFLLAFLYLCLYLAKKSDQSFLFAFLEFLSLSLVSQTSGDRLIYFLLPALPFEFFAKIQTLSVSTMLIFIIAYTRSVRRSFLPTWYVGMTYFATLLYSTVVLLTPYSVYARLTGFWDAFFILSQLCLLWMLWRLYRTIDHPLRRAETLLSGCCLGTLMICMANNFLYNFNWVLSKAIGSIAICLFVILSVAAIALRLIASMDEAVQNEVAFLQAQIKPHFIYNAINTIVSFCYTDGERAAGLLTNFSKYLRLIFNEDNRTQKVPLRREIDLVHAFMKIEQARFGDNIRIKYEIDEDLINRRIPPLIIQPLVENAISHGLRPKEKGGIVTVSVRAPHNVLTIVVTDTGVGMPEEQVKRIQSAEDVNGGIGLVNVRRRVDRWKNAQMKISSTEGVGTVVTITVKA